MDLLGTIEEYKGQGAGSLILKHGCELADKEGVECYIASSPAGKRLYERFGFVFTEWIDLPYGHRDDFGIRQPCKVK